MTVLVTCGLVFTIGFVAGALIAATILILTEPEREPIPEQKAGMFPSYQSYLIQRGDLK